jgi:hypothetical protein
VFYLLGSGDECRIHDGGLGVFRHKFLALFNQTLHGLALFTFWTDSKGSEDLLQALDVVFGLLQVFFKAVAQIGLPVRPGLPSI